MPSSHLQRVGRRAPPLCLRTGHETVTLDGFGTQPIVVALVGAPFAARGEEDDLLAEVRAELRGLGAVLLLLSPAGILVLGADDEAQWFSSRRDVHVEDLERAFAQFGIRRDQDGAACAGLFLVDGARCLRFAHIWDDDGEGSLVAIRNGLVAAGRAVIAARERFLLSRRDLVMTSLVAAFSLILLDGCKRDARLAADVRSVGPTPIEGEHDVTLDVNGARRTVRVDTRTSLLDALRERMGLTGTKKGCDHGQCGACTVHLDGRRVNSCMVLAVAAEGAKITTIEGLARGEALHPMQEAFVVEDALQCGYCTPGQIMSAVALVTEGHATTDDEVREQMSGNICRCGAYTNIVAAIQRARKV
ncbi:MAG TPA: 2Fe-2S iron-sulfur cluster-binding protein [Polyangiaceae bacterium]|nr:2Fe-2S iron-sulfur cluster-binding protein [Polyangiaceae bacterium]